MKIAPLRLKFCLYWELHNFLFLGAREWTNYPRFSGRSTLGCAREPDNWFCCLRDHCRRAAELSKSQMYGICILGTVPFPDFSGTMRQIMTIYIIIIW